MNSDYELERRWLDDTEDNESVPGMKDEDFYLEKYQT